MFREELVEGLAATDDRSAQRDSVRFACERPGAGFAGLLVPYATVPVGIVLAVFQQRAIRFEPLPTRLAAATATVGTRTFARTASAACRCTDNIRRTGYVRRGSLHRDRLERRSGRRGDRQRDTCRQVRLIRNTLDGRVVQLCAANNGNRRRN